jgi:23S rRNA pseudouridine1911/1915/1917 synthase
VDAISLYRTMEAFEGAALLEVRLVTGKRNQIRIQASLHGHPLVGERQYVDRARASAFDFPRQALHAFRLTIRHPRTGRPLVAEAQMPADLEALLASLRAGTLHGVRAGHSGGSVSRRRPQGLRSR